MISITPIHTLTDKRYHRAEQLLTLSFPKEERRDISEWRRLFLSEPTFSLNVLSTLTPLATPADTLEAPFLGFISCWAFEEFLYIEHFAISPEYRGAGYGTKLLKTFLQEREERAVLLEVEPPCEQDALPSRRIAFYERCGFTLWHSKYQQPPYRKGDSYLPMQLMSYGDLSEKRDYERIKRILWDKVYNCQK